MLLLLELIVSLMIVLCVTFLNLLDVSLGTILRDGYRELHARLGKPSGLTTIDPVGGRLRPYRDQLRAADRDLFDLTDHIRWVLVGLLSSMAVLLFIDFGMGERIV
jgi:hypothetical protein